MMAAISDRVEPMPAGWRVRRPPHRFDMRIEADLIEEVARLRGFDSIAESHAIAPQIAGYATESQVSTDRLLSAMVDRGYREAITYSFVDPVVQHQLFPDTPALVLSNPISADLSEMRVSLWTGLIHTCRENLRRQQTACAAVRNRQEVRPADRRACARSKRSPASPPARAGRSSGASVREALDFYDVKARCAALLALTGEAGRMRFVADSLQLFASGTHGTNFRDSTPIGWLGELHPQLVKSLDLSSAVFLFELEIDSAFMSKPLQLKQISKFPSVRRDLAIIVDESGPSRSFAGKCYC